jgi:hypothetical protein
MTHLVHIREALAAASEPVGMTVPEMIDGCGLTVEGGDPVAVHHEVTDSPGDGRGAGGVAATPAPVSHAAPAHVHLGGGPCVYGERCGQ